MGTFISQADTPELFAEKSPAPGATLPTNWTTANVTEASDLNEIQAALLDCRTAIRTPPAVAVTGLVAALSDVGIHQTFVATVDLEEANDAALISFEDYEIPAAGAVSDFHVSGLTVSYLSGTPLDTDALRAWVTAKTTTSITVKLGAPPGSGVSVTVTATLTWLQPVEV